MIEESASQFANTDRAERELRRDVGGELSVDLGGDRSGRLFVLGNAPADLLPATAVVDVPAAVVTEIGDLSDSLAERFPSTGTTHRAPPDARFVHKEGYFHIA